MNCSLEEIQSYAEYKSSEVYHRLKKRYLPELRALLSDCVWLKSALAINDSRGLHPNEAKLLQFVALIEAVIAEISDLKAEKTSSNSLLALENKILRSILPVKTRLHERWKQQLEVERGEISETECIASSSSKRQKSFSRTNDKLSVCQKKIAAHNDRSNSFISSDSLELKEKAPLREREDDCSVEIVDTLPCSFARKEKYEEESFQVNDELFDNISDCGVDLLDEEDGFNDCDFGSFEVTSPETSSLSDSNSCKRKLECSSSAFPAIKREKPRGPFYSSAVDIDLSNTFSNSIVTLKEEEYMSSRRRRKLNQIVPFPRKPRSADYSCSLCGEGYQRTVNENPWWAVYKHECPYCKQYQIPRIDIGIPINAIELDPNVIALYGEGIEDSGDEGEESDEYTDDEDIDADDKETVKSKDEVTSPLLSSFQAPNLILLMHHARSCSGCHPSSKHEEICRCTKFLMLHLRDCKGLDFQKRPCRFPWCQPCKSLLKHLTTCSFQASCIICHPRTFSNFTPS